MFYGDWSSVEEMANDFAEDVRVFSGCNFIIAHYSYANYSGEAYVLYEYNGKLYEVHGSHCSCYGLESQWSPEVVTIEYLERMINTDSYIHRGEYRDELVKYIDNAKLKGL